MISKATAEHREAEMCGKIKEGWGKRSGSYQHQGDYLEGNRI